jgi:hypothetical protein
MSIAIEKLKQEIMMMRSTLNQLASTSKHLHDPVIVQYSQMLDSKINHYHALIAIAPYHQRVKKVI